MSAIPEGWKLVPVEPTKEMLSAINSSVYLPNCYRAMLAAAPQPPVSHAKPENQAEPNNGGACVSQPVASAWMHGGQIVNAFPWPPTDKRSSDEDKYWRDKGFSSAPLYATPQPTKREPLTDEQIDAVTVAQWGRHADYLLPAYRAYARAIERAHGIGGEA